MCMHIVKDGLTCSRSQPLGWNRLKLGTSCNINNNDWSYCGILTFIYLKGMVIFDRIAWTILYRSSTNVNFKKGLDCISHLIPFLVLDYASWYSARKIETSNTVGEPILEPA